MGHGQEIQIMINPLNEFIIIGTSNKMHLTVTDTTFESIFFSTFGKLDVTNLPFSRREPVTMFQWSPPEDKVSFIHSKMTRQYFGCCSKTVSAREPKLRDFNP